MAEGLLKRVEDVVEGARVRSCCGRHLDGFDRIVKPQSCMIRLWVLFSEQVARQ